MQELNNSYFIPLLGCGVLGCGVVLAVADAVVDVIAIGSVVVVEVAEVSVVVVESKENI